jgi:hypothetical protein
MSSILSMYRELMGGTLSFTVMKGKYYTKEAKPRAYVSRISKYLGSSIHINITLELIIIFIRVPIPTAPQEPHLAHKIP